VSGLDQYVMASGATDTMSPLAARLYSPISGRTTYHGIPAPKRTVAPLGHAAPAASPATATARSLQGRPQILLAASFQKRSGIALARVLVKISGQLL
jgi:hypothetical protein